MVQAHCSLAAYTMFTIVYPYLFRSLATVRTNKEKQQIIVVVLHDRD